MQISTSHLFAWFPSQNDETKPQNVQFKKHSKTGAESSAAAAALTESSATEAESSAAAAALTESLKLHSARITPNPCLLCVLPHSHVTELSLYPEKSADSSVSHATIRHGSSVFQMLANPFTPVCKPLMVPPANLHVSHGLPIQDSA